MGGDGGVGSLCREFEKQEKFVLPCTSTLDVVLGRTVRAERTVGCISSKGV